jgi:hypothetical protein
MNLRIVVNPRVAEHVAHLLRADGLSVEGVFQTISPSVRVVVLDVPDTPTAQRAYDLVKPCDRYATVSPPDVPHACHPRGCWEIH